MSIMKLILIRHGESMSNIGQSPLSDSCLTPLGERQAEATGAYLKTQGIDLLLCSLMDRALHTAYTIAQAGGMPVRLWPELTEMGYCWQETGLPRSAMETKFAGFPFPDEADEEGWARHKNHETQEEVFHRMKLVADRLMELGKDGSVGTLACVIHGRSGNELIKHLLRVPFESPFYMHHGNCGITIMQLEPDFTHVLAMNDLRHLSALQTEDPAVKEYK